MRAENIDFSFMSDVDITSIFANLWDNAIEACMELSPPERLINITLTKKGEIIIIQFENAFNGNLSSEEGNVTGLSHERYLTTKDGFHAGLGLQIIEAAAEKYGGHFLITHTTNLFTATLMLKG
jgi:sensor histidine kinase regulating citrate/malate metabolism